MTADKKRMISGASARLALPVLLIVWVLFIGFQLCRVFHTPVWRDDATFAEVAKNITLGKGYALTSFDILVPFGRGISSGPVVILPTALMIEFFGNAYWVPGLTSVIIINCLLIAAFFQLRRMIPSDTIRCQCATLFLLACMLICNHYTGLSGELMHIWHALMGEVPSALCVIIAVLYIASNRFAAKTLFTGGLIAGLGTLCKLQAMIGVGILGIYLAAHYVATYQKKNLTLRQSVSNLILYGIGALLPLILFELVKIVNLGGLQNYSGSIGEITAAAQETNGFSLPSVLEKMYMLSEYLGIMHDPLEGAGLYSIFLIVMAIALLQALYLCLRSAIRHIHIMDAPVQWACNALSLCCAAHLMWWILVSSMLMPRYATQGILYGCASLALAVAQKTLHNPAQGSRNFFIVALIMMCMRYDAVVYLFTAMEYNPYLSEQQEVTQKLTDIKKQNPDAVFFSCGYTFEMEYLLPQSQNFTECERIEEPTFAKKNKILVSFTFENSGKLISGKNGDFGLILRDNTDLALRHCPSPDLYAGHNYFIASCTP